MKMSFSGTVSIRDAVFDIEIASDNYTAFGLTHNPRIEDFPVMPMERVSVMLKPDGFFTKNPALDVPQSSQSFNKSTLHPEATSCCAAPSASAASSKAKLYKRMD